MDNFSNNAFSDFAPLLTLFGDEVTKQFLATSMGFADTVLLGLAPIGIMTVLVSAIRVGGNRLMKAIIGRARDSPDDEEKELLSSTSVNVREIWDGNRVIRQTGGSKTVTFVFDPDLVKYVGLYLRKIEEPPPGATRGYKEVTRHSTNWIRRQPGEKLEAQPSPGQQEASTLDPMFPKISPNLTLNIGGAISHKATTWLFMCIGLLVQIAVIFANAWIVYRLQWLRGGTVVASYGFPTWATGTLAISIGTSICGWIVESSSRKGEIKPRKADPSPTAARIILLQKSIPDQNMPAYWIEPVAPGGNLKVSRRIFPPAPDDPFTKAEPGVTRRREWWTAAGALFTLGGFVCQNVGTRELHWSAGLLQLGATLILTLLRALLRANVGNPLKTEEVSGGTSEATKLNTSKATKLNKDFPACHLATQLTEYEFYMPIAASDSQLNERVLPEIELGVPEVDEEKLGEWKGKSYERYISSVLNTLDQYEVRLPLHASDFQLNERVLPEIELTLSEVDQKKLGEWKRNGKSYERFISNVLNTQAFIADFEPDVGNMFKMATSCYDAMEEIMANIGKARHFPGHIAYLMVKGSRPPEPQDGAGMHPVEVLALTRVTWPVSSEKALDRIRFLQAIINLTRYVYTSTWKRPETSQYGKSIYRIIDHCKRTEVEESKYLVAHWLRLNTSYIMLRNLHPRKRGGGAAGGVAQFEPCRPYNALVFGLPFSWAFQQNFDQPIHDGKGKSEALQREAERSNADFELILGDYEVSTDSQKALDRNIVLELISTFMLQAVEEFEADFRASIKNSDVGVNKLVDILVKHGVCRSEEEGRIAVVPSLIHKKVLSWPEAGTPT